MARNEATAMTNEDVKQLFIRLTDDCIAVNSIDHIEVKDVGLTEADDISEYRYAIQTNSCLIGFGFFERMQEAFKIILVSCDQDKLSIVVELKESYLSLHSLT